MMVPGLARLRDRFDAILLDLDGTLLDGEGALTPRTRGAVGALEAAGVMPVLCTGRSVAGTRPVHDELGLQRPFVAYNGHWIGQPGEEPWHTIHIPDEQQLAIRRIEDLANFSFRHSAERKISLLSDHPEHLRIAAWYRNVTLLQVRDELPDRDLMRVSAFFQGQLDQVETAWATLDEHAVGALHKEVFPLSLFPSYEDSDLVLCEIQAQSRGKAEAFGWLESEHGIGAERTIAVGDHCNDRTMLSGAGLAVCPANAAPEVRHLADMFIGHHAQEGFASWIESGAPFPDPAERVP